MKLQFFDRSDAKKLWYFLLMLPLCVMWAKEDKASLELSGPSALVPGGSIQTVKLSPLGAEVAGASFAAYNTTRLISQPEGLVKLYYPTSSATRPTGEASVTVTVTYLALINDKLESKSLNATLSIKLEAATVKNVDFVRLPQAVKILSTNITVANVPSSFVGIKLYHEVRADLYTVLNLQRPAQINSGFTLTHSDALLGQNGTLEVTWSALAGAESYELEWTYVSDQDPNDVNARLPLAQVQVRDYLFRHNSSRVSTVNTSYSIPLVYEKGLILYRLRAVGKNQVGGKLIDVKSLWSADENFTNLSSYPVANIYTFAGLETDFNWQSSISYAEEGKNKTVMSYHDGTSRNRQAVTKINTDQRAVVGETMYDYNGRPQIQVLPVPVKENDLSYRPHFNLIEGKGRLEKSQYDIATEGNGCDVAAPKLDTAFGASNYYSPHNHFDNDPANIGNKLLNKNLIPDAKKYPYTQTYYTNDNTGRIAAQSGVGDNYLIGSDHETKYLYGSPDQPEISRLFGTDVGNAAHYKKNVVRDPNGQVSVSYLDMDGKVVATALSGKAPDAVSELPGDKTRTISASLLDQVSYPLSGDYNYKEYLSTFAVGEEAKYKFAYTGTVGGYSFSCTDKVSNQTKTISLSGVVDVEFKLIDKCKKTLINSFTTTNYSTATSATQSINLPLMADGGTVSGEVTLKAGQYDVIKRVSINQQKLDQYWQYYSTNAQYNCVLVDSNFVKDEKAKISLAGCEVSCEACSTQINTLLSNPEITFSVEEKYRIEHMCDILCSANAKCQSGLNPMLADVSPDGQYGKIRRDKVAQIDVNGPDKNDFEQNGVNYNGFEVSVNSSADGGDADNPDDANIDPSQFPMSIFNNNNRLRSPQLTLTPNTSCFSSVKVSWQHPIRIYFDDIASSGTKTPSANSYTNQVLFDGNKDFSTAIYEEVDYRDASGQKVYATLKKIDPSLPNCGATYNLGITDCNKVETISASDNAYRIPIKYLADVKDFLPFWDRQYANYLVVYHPEFRYFIECTSNKASNAYEKQLLSISEYQEAISQGLLLADGTPQILTKDPLYTSDTKAKQFLSYMYNNYQNLGTSGTPIYKSMPQIVTKSVDCPAGSDQCGTSTDAVCYSGTILTNEKWVMLVGIYLAERQKYEHKKVSQIAVSKGFFNGCVGDNRFYVKEDAWNYFYNPYQQAPTVQVNLCRFRYWWWYNTAYTANNNNCCVNLNRNSYWYFNIPLFDFAQTCNVWEYGLYGDKNRRFEPTQDMVNNGLSLDEGTCTVTIPTLGSEPAYTIATPCLSQAQNYIDKGTKAAEAIKYEKCGLCPVATDLEQFLLGIKKKSFFTTTTNTEALISCTNSSNYVAMGGTLQKQFHSSTNNNYPQLYWKGVLSNGNKTLTGTLRNSLTGISKTITLDIPSTETKTFADISFCCLSTDKNTPNDFKMRGVYYTPAPENKRIEFDIAGHIDVALAPCTVPPSCYSTSMASEVSNFLNMLLFANAGNKSKQLQLALATDNVVLSDDNVRALYEPSVRSLINLDQPDAVTGLYAHTFDYYTPKWYGIKTATALEGKLTLSNTSITTIDVVITPSNASAISNFNDIVRFTNVRAFSDPSCSESSPYCENTKFVADAVLMVSGVKTFAEVTIQVPQLTMSICKPVVFVKQ